MKKSYLYPIIVAVVVAILATSCGSRTEPLPPTPPPPNPVDEGKIHLGEVTLVKSTSEVELPLIIGYEEYN